MNRLSLLLLTFPLALLAGCSLAPDFHMPDLHLPGLFKEQPAVEPLTHDDSKTDSSKNDKAQWSPAKPLEKSDRGNWWKIFDDTALNDLETQAADANPSLKAAAARVEQARGIARANGASMLPELDIGANAVRTKPADAALAAFGQPGGKLKPYTLYSTQATLSYEADLFGRIRDIEKAYNFDADAQAATYRSVLLALQADVAQQYFSLRTLDAERQLLRKTITVYTEAERIMKRRFEEGDTAAQDHARTQNELAAAQAQLIALDRQRANAEHALAVLLGKLPSDFTFAENPLAGTPPHIGADIPASVLERRPDISAAINSMAAANARIGAARAAFFPDLSLTASGGLESITLAELFKWSSRTWAVGQLAGMALSMPIFDNGRNAGNLAAADASYQESLATYREHVLTAFREVEDNLSDQRLLSEQSQKATTAAEAADLASTLTEKRYQEGDIDYFQVADAHRTALAADQAALQTNGQRFLTTVTLIRALGGGWE